MKANLKTRKPQIDRKSAGKICPDDLIIAQHLKNNNLMDYKELADKYGISDDTLRNKLNRLNNLPDSDDKSIADNELRQIINFLITYKKRLVLTLGTVNFDDFKSFDDITKALKTLAGIFSPLHAAYRAETQKTAATVISFTGIVERNWENDEKRKQKIVEVLSKKV